MAKKIEWKPARGGKWRQKRDAENPNHGKLVTVPKPMEKRFGKGTMLIPSPRDVDAVMRRAKTGKLLTQSQIRAKLARKAGARLTCPLCTGIFVRIAAEAAEEDRQDGRAAITPYWRTIKDDGSLNEKFPGGPAAQAARLQEEGFEILPGKGKKPPKVRDFEKFLMR